jgi:hypothetical protein
MVAQHNSRLG